MRSHIFLSLLFATFAFLLPLTEVMGSEAATDATTAVSIFQAGISSHPEQIVPLFQDSLRTNPDYGQELIQAALERPNLDSDTLVAILAIARLEFPERDSQLAELALSMAPDRSTDIRTVFLASNDEMSAHIASQLHPSNHQAAEPRDESLNPDQQMDQELKKAIARVEAKIRGSAQVDSKFQLQKQTEQKSDEIRISRDSWNADESTLTNHLPLDHTDEREMATGNAQIDDARQIPPTLQLDESKFGPETTGELASPPTAKVRSIAPAASVGLPLRPRLAQSSVYRIPASSEAFDSTIDQTTGEPSQPPLIIRPPAMKSSNPQMDMIHQ